MNWEKEIIKIIRADEYDHEDVGHNETTLKVCNFIREHFSQDDESRPVEKLVMPNERELINHYNNEESQEWLNAPLGKPQANGAVAGHWQDNKPDRPCYFVYRDDENDNYPNLYEAVLEDNILTVYNIQDDEYIYSMEEMADGQFFIVEK